MQDWQLVILQRLLCTQLMITCTSCDAGKPVSIDHNRGEGVASFIHPLQWRQSSFILNLIIHQNMHASVTSYYNSCTHMIQFIIRLAPHAFSSSSDVQSINQSVGHNQIDCSIRVFKYFQSMFQCAQ